MAESRKRQYTNIVPFYRLEIQSVTLEETVTLPCFSLDTSNRSECFQWIQRVNTSIPKNHTICRYFCLLTCRCIVTAKKTFFEKSLKNADVIWSRFLLLRMSVWFWCRTISQLCTRMLWFGILRNLIWIWHIAMLNFTIKMYHLCHILSIILYYRYISATLCSFTCRDFSRVVCTRAWYYDNEVLRGLSRCRLVQLFC